MKPKTFLSLYKPCFQSSHSLILNANVQKNLYWKMKFLFSISDFTDEEFHFWLLWRNLYLNKISKLNVKYVILELLKYT